MLVVLVTVACSSAPPGASLPPPVPTVELQLLDDSIRYDRPVPAGRVVFRVANRGGRSHRVALIPLPEDYPPIAEQLRGTTRRSVALVARVPDLAPGETGTFAVDLVAGGRYGLVDYSKSPDGTLYARLGVASEFRPQGRQSTPTIKSVTTVAAK